MNELPPLTEEDRKRYATMIRSRGEKWVQQRIHEHDIRLQVRTYSHVKPPEAERRVSLWLAMHPESSTSEIAEGTHLHPVQVGQTLSHFGRRGLAMKLRKRGLGHAVWRLSARGELLIEEIYLRQRQATKKENR